MKIDKINVKTKDTNYQILIGNGALGLLKKQINILCPKSKKIALILDKNIPNYYKKKIKSLLKKYKVFSKEYLPKENLKNFNQVNFLVENLIENKFNRNDIIIAVGGGIIGDFAGFVASILKRGVNFINVPTTLLAQVDSSIGGKTGVNSKTGKNLIGSFYQPKLVISELSFLKSLPKREFVCGFGEVLKYSLIRDKNFFKFIKKNSEIILQGKNFNVLKNLIIRSSKNKVYFVTADEKESGKRMILNFGHTFAHAIEVKNNYSKNVTHGEAVLVGMILATKLSIIKKVCNQTVLKELIEIYKKNNLSYVLKKYKNSKEINNLIPYLKNDKKNNDEKINFILINKIGKTTLPNKHKISINELKKNIKHLTQY